MLTAKPCYCIPTIPGCQYCTTTLDKLRSAKEGYEAALEENDKLSRQGSESERRALDQSIDAGIDFMENVQEHIDIVLEIPELKVLVVRADRDARLNLEMRQKDFDMASRRFETRQMDFDMALERWKEMRECMSDVGSILLGNKKRGPQGGGN